MCRPPGFADEFVRLGPVLEQIGVLCVVQADIEVMEQSGEEVVYFPRYVQNVFDPEQQRIKRDDWPRSQHSQ